MRDAVERVVPETEPHLGDLDEIVAVGQIHVERMSAQHVWMAVAGVAIDLYAEKGPHGWQLTMQTQNGLPTPSDAFRACRG